MICNRHVLEVRKQRIVRPEQAADVRRVMNGSVEICVVAYDRGQKHFGIALRYEFALPSASTQCPAKLTAQVAALHRGKLHIGVEISFIDPFARIQNEFSDRDTGARL